jgi:mannose-6-phosphate isomerase-like protein (cupin superfamily)
MRDRLVSYTIRNIEEVEDSAAKFGFGELQEARFPRGALDADTTGLAHIRVRPGKRQPFAHVHHSTEEIYVVLNGSGRVKLDDAIEDVGRLDAIRIGPGVVHAFEAGPDGLELLVFGPHAADDRGDMIHDHWD